MVGTVGAARRQGGTRSLARALGAFTIGLLAGSGATFAALGLLGVALRPGPAWTIGVAAGCLVAAAADAFGLRVRPQIRRQVPERWRRTMRLSVASLLYGGLLGTGVSSAVPAAAAWALTALSVTLASLSVALAIGVGFAIGRVLPLLALAPLEARGAGGRALQIMSERPAALRAVRLGAAVALAAAAAALLAGGSGAAQIVTPEAGDPSAAETDLAWQQPGVGGFLRRAGQTAQLPGDDPAIGGALVAWHQGPLVTVANRETLAPLFQEQIAGVRQLAVSDAWLVLRTVDPGGNSRLIAQSVADTSVHRELASERAPALLGRPAISAATVVFAVAKRTGSWIVAADLGAGTSRRVRTSGSDQLLNPSLLGSDLLYAEVSRCSQQLRLGSLAGTGGRVLLTLPALAGQDAGHEQGHTAQGSHTPCRGRPRTTTKLLWTTALGPSAAYVTTLSSAGGGASTPSLLELPR